MDGFPFGPGPPTGPGGGGPYVPTAGERLTELDSVAAAQSHRLADNVCVDPDPPPLSSTIPPNLVVTATRCSFPGQLRLVILPPMPTYGDGCRERDPASGDKVWLDILSILGMGYKVAQRFNLWPYPPPPLGNGLVHPLTTLEVHVGIAGTLVRDTHQPRCRPSPLPPQLRPLRCHPPSPLSPFG